MSSDDDRIAFLMGENVEVDDDDAAALEEMRALLADPSLWASPDPELEARVVAAVLAEARATGVPAPTSFPARAPAAARESAPTPTPPVISLEERRRIRWPTVVVASAAAVAAIVIGLVAITRGTSEERVQFALAPTELLPDAAGEVTITAEQSGLRIELDATGLPRRDGGDFYQAWLRSADGVLIPIGTFHEGTDVVLWAGVALEDFPTLTITEESDDNDQGSSGRRVLVGMAPVGD